MRPIVNLAKNTLNQGKLLYYHIEQNRGAIKTLKAIEKEKGKLPTKQVKLCKEYAKDIFGSEKYAPWLMVYSAYSREFKEGWIPDNYYGEVVVPELKGGYGQICNRNAIISSLIEETDTLDICYFVNHLFLDPNFSLIKEDELKSLLFNKTKKIVFKVEDSRQGKGVYFFDEHSFELNTIKKLGNGVFQSYIQQHPFFSEFTQSSVATIRITSTSNLSGEININAGYLRFGREKDTHVMSAYAMRIAIDINAGRLSNEAYFPNWKSTQKLPNNDFSFGEKILPSFNICLNEVKRMHKKIPYIRCIGWDIIVDKNNDFKLIELNGGHNSITFNETVQGPCFKGLGWENLKKTY